MSVSAGQTPSSTVWRPKTLTTSPVVIFHLHCIARNPIQSFGVAILANSRELWFHLFHSDFHVDYCFGGVKMTSIARPRYLLMYFFLHGFTDFPTYPTSERSFSRFSFALERSWCSNLRTTGTGNWNASSQVLNVRGSGASAAMLAVCGSLCGKCTRRGGKSLLEVRSMSWRFSHHNLWQRVWGR